MDNVCAVRRINGFGCVAQHSEINREGLEQASVANDRQQQHRSVLWPVGEMRTTALLTDDDDRRRSAEEFIKNTYATRYGARLETFPSRIIALLDHRDEILCAAGLRFLEDGFFSECYLDTPIEDVVSATSARAVNRSAIFEVTTLASCAPRATAEFIAAIGNFGEKAGFEWSFFTLTRRLHLMVSRLGIVPTLIAEADRRRIADSERWGSYYACQPKVYAVASRRLKMSCGGSQGEEWYAPAV
jgi:hypothetical protein